MQIRRAVPQDALAVETVRVDTWKVAYRGLVPDAFLADLEVNPERVQVWRDRIAAVETATWVAEHEDDVIGLAVSGPSRDEDLLGHGELYALYVDPRRWCGGVGTALLTACGPVDVLWVLERNGRARSFYERHGSTPDGTAKTIDLGSPVEEIRYRRTPALPT